MRGALRLFISVASSSLLLCPLFHPLRPLHTRLFLSACLSITERTPSGRAATCATLTPGGGLYFHCRRCDAAGLRPFDGARALEFWLKPRGASALEVNATAAGNATGGGGNETAVGGLRTGEGVQRGEKH